MKVKRVESSLIPFRVNLIVEAETHETAVFLSLVGMRRYYVNTGERYKIRVPSKWLKTEGDDVRLGLLVEMDQDKFKWKFLD